MLPEQAIGTKYLGSDKQLPRGSIDLGNDYVLLRAQDQMRSMRKCEAEALITYLTDQCHINILTATSGSSPEDWCPNIARWARLRLPNGQIARSRWKEAVKPLDKIRISRNVKVIFKISDTFTFHTDNR